MDFYQLNLLLRYAKEYGHDQMRVAGLSDTEHTLCAFLFGHAGSSQDEAAAALRLDKTTVARALQTLEDKAYITRRPNPKNRRKNLLELTPAGRQSIAPVISVYDEWLADISACLSAEEQRQFQALCSRLLQAAKEKSEGKSS